MQPIFNLLQNRARLILIALVLLPLLFVYFFIFGPRASSKLHEMEEELSKIKPFENLSLKHYSAAKKITVALVTANYLTTNSPDSIFTYYMNEFVKRGWIFCCDIEHENKKEMLFKKMEYTAYISYLFDEQNALIINISWGLGGCEADCKD